MRKLIVLNTYEATMKEKCIIVDAWYNINKNEKLKTR